jgi:predicted  nucleic acid-binding Zn-ribbon protein
MKIKVKDSPHLFRDGKTNAIVNTNKMEYDNYLKMKNAKEKEKQKLSNLESELESVKNDISEIKSLILGLYNK